MSIASSNSRDVGDDEAQLHPLTAEAALALAMAGTRRQRVLDLGLDGYQPGAAQEIIGLLERLAPAYRARAVHRRGRTLLVVEPRGPAAL